MLHKMRLCSNKGFRPNDHTIPTFHDPEKVAF